MAENVNICYQGATYALGQGPSFYGIWTAATPQSPPLEWWPHTPDGWSAAWSRFTALEAPGTIIAVGPAGTGHGGMTAQAGATAQAAAGPGTLAGADVLPASRPGIARIAAALIVAGVAVGVAGLFPVYTDGASLAAQAYNVVPHAIYLAAWSLSAVLILLGGARLRTGALVGLGVSVVTFGLFLADAGTPISGGAHLMGAGLALSLIGWLACTAGVLLAVRSAPVGRISRIRSVHEIVPTVTLIIAGIGTAIAFAPAWDKFTLNTAAGVTQTLTAGNAFDNPGAVIVGDVAVMVGLVAMVIAAALWRPARLGAALVAGAAIPMVAQAISALVQINGPFTPAQFGVSAAQARLLGLTINAGLTPMFWVYCAFLIILMLIGAWLLMNQDQTVAIWPSAPWSSGPQWPQAAPQSPAADEPAAAGQGAGQIQPAPEPQQ